MTYIHSAQHRHILILEAFNAWRSEPCKRTAWLLKLRLEA